LDSSTTSASDSEKLYRKSKKAHKNEKQLSKRQQKEVKRIKKVMEGVRIKPPFVWNGKPDMDIFDHWTYKVDTWIKLTGLTDKVALKLLVNFMSGSARRWFMLHVATSQE
jgi:hypothetical protein